MGLSLPVVWTDLHRRHRPDAEVWLGVRTPATELPERAERIREALVAAGAPVVESRPHSDGAVLAVHDRALLDYLAGAWIEWREAGLTEQPGQGQVVPYAFPHTGMLGDQRPRSAAAIGARAGQFAYDTMTLIGPGTWEAARAGADAALTAAELVLNGEPVA